MSCDGKQPSCTQCSFRGLTCPGYTPPWTFVSQDPRTGRTARDKPLEPTSQPQRAEGLMLLRFPSRPQQLALGDAAQATAVYQTLTPPLDDLIRFIVRSYVPETNHRRISLPQEVEPRVCGAWVEVLPELSATGRNVALSSAIKAFAGTLMSGVLNKHMTMEDARQNYTHALRCLRDELRVASPSSSLASETAAAIMCLLLAELFMPTTLESWTAHLAGFAQSMRTAGPAFYRCGTPHRLFVGARPILTVLGFIVRKASFLEAAEWKHIPFSMTPPSPLQELMGEAITIPRLLENLDKAAGSPREVAVLVATDTLREIIAVFDSLDRWQQTFHSRWLKAPLFGSITLSEEVAGRDWPNFWFPGITDANVATHYWAFRVVCLATVRQISILHPEIPFDHEDLAWRLPEGNSFLEMKQLSTWIVQSMDYLMQEEMKLFGPSSVLLPLRVAYDVFLAGGFHTEKELGWCREFLTGTIASGYRFVPLFFDPWQQELETCINPTTINIAARDPYHEHEPVLRIE
ncbi:hypothetical protein OQA88_5653 [Cercophora sp. LCS_1]